MPSDLPSRHIEQERQRVAHKPPAKPRPLGRRVSIQLAAWMRWLHIYLSMFGLAAVLFFSVTGVTLNHPDWFFSGAEQSVPAEGAVEVKWLHLDTPTSAASKPADGALPAEPDRSREVDQLRVVEHLRARHGVGGALADFRVDERECTVTFKGPGYAADAFVDRETGKYTLTQTYHGFVAVINDLHKGRDTGPVWSAVIDVSAVFMTAISLTGLVLIFYLKLRRKPGLAVGVLGTLVVLAVLWIWVP